MRKILHFKKSLLGIVSIVTKDLGSKYSGGPKITVFFFFLFLFFLGGGVRYSIDIAVTDNRLLFKFLIQFQNRTLIT